MYAHLKNGTRILDVADLRQYIYEMMSNIRTNALAKMRHKPLGPLWEGNLSWPSVEESTVREPVAL
jgi:hypothetical protein